MIEKEERTNHIENVRPVGGDCFKLMYARRSNETLESHLKKFNYNDYWVLKSSGHQRLVTYDDLLEFKYASYIFFKKDLYDIDKIIEWIEYFKSMGGVQYLDKPTPPFNPKKIKIVV